MVGFLYKLHLIVLLCRIISVNCDNKHEALHFSRDMPRRSFYDKKLYEKVEDFKIIEPTAIACPAKSEEEITFNETHSIGKNSLFVRNTYEEGELERNIDYQICDNTYKLSSIYDVMADEFQFGIEIYYDKLEYESKTFYDSIRGRYDQISNVHSIRNYFKSKIAYITSIRPISYLPYLPGVSRITQEAKLYIGNAREREVGFIWIHIFEMIFNFNMKRLVQTTYRLVIHTRGFHDCDNFDLGKEYFSDIKIDELYNKDNQKIMLEGVKLPSLGLNDDHREAACESEFKCFAKWLSIPSEQFHFLGAQPVSCSNLLTVPIWKSTIEYTLNKLDNFLHAFSQVISIINPFGRITVHSGIQGILELRMNPDHAKPTKAMKLGARNMHVPDIIYKIVKYVTKICEETENEDGNVVDDKNDEPKKVKCKFSARSVIFVIHNNPYFDPKTDSICEDVCEGWGWEEIQYRNLPHGKFRSKYIYCCSSTIPEVRKKLEIKPGTYENYEIDGKIEFRELGLRFIAVPNFETMTFQHKDYHDVVILKYKELFEKSDSESRKDKEIEISENNPPTIEYSQIKEPEDDADEPDMSKTQQGDGENAENLSADENPSEEKKK